VFTYFGLSVEVDFGFELSLDTVICPLFPAPTSGPEMLRAVEISSTNITIAWDAVNCAERNSNITGYVVHFTPPSTSGNDRVMVSGTGDAGGMVTIDGLTPYTQYSIQVAAVNSDGSIGLATASLSVTTSGDLYMYCNFLIRCTLILYTT